MQSLARDGYTKKEVIDVLHSKKGPRTLRFRYDLLDKNNQYIRTLNSVLSGEVSMSSLADIKRTARFSLQDDGQIDFLNDRIQPFVEVKIPEIKRTHNDYALEFDGVDDYVVTNTKIPDVFTVSLLLRPSGTVNSSGFFDAWSSSNNTGLLMRRDSASDYSRVFVGNGSAITGNYGISTPSNRWTNITVSFNGSRLSIYIDGQLIHSTNTSYISGSSLQLGRRVNGALNYWDGQIDDVQIWNRALSQAEIQANVGRRLTGNEEGLISLWRFDEGSSGVAKDSTGNGNDGTINGATWVKNGIWVETIPSKYISFPQGIFLLSTPTRRDQTNGVFRDVEAYGGLVILRDDKFETRYVIQTGIKYYDAIVNILVSAGISKYNIEYTDAVLPRAMEFEAGKEKLFAINELLRQINYTPIWDDANGVFTSSYYRSPAVRAIDYTYRDDELSVTYKGVEEELDLYNVPNKWVVVCSNAENEPLVATYTNDNPDSPTSTVNRGRTIVDYREVQDIADQASLDAYVQRIAFEASQVYGKIVFETAIMPMHDYADVLEVDYSPLNIIGKYSETSWTMPLSVGSKMKHELRKVVTI